jgi:starvation-inducible DNA-binding protein
MDELINQLKVVLADTVAFGMKTHFFHWNVEGEDFFQFHQLFERIYEEVEGSVDSIGEQIKTLDATAPLGPRRIAELTTIEEAMVASDPMNAVRVLYADNAKVMTSIMECYKTCERYSVIGVSNVLQDRYTAHANHQYLLRSTLKNTEI